MDLQEIREIALTFAAVAGALGAVSAFLVALWKARSIPEDVAKAMRTRIEQWVDLRRARVERERRMSTLLDLLPAIHEHFQPNGGSALWDRVEANRGATEGLHKAMTDQFEALPGRIADSVAAAVTVHEQKKHARRR